MSVHPRERTAICGRSPTEGENRAVTVFSPAAVHGEGAQDGPKTPRLVYSDRYTKEGPKMSDSSTTTSTDHGHWLLDEGRETDRGFAGRRGLTTWSIFRTRRKKRPWSVKVRGPDGSIDLSPFANPVDAASTLLSFEKWEPLPEVNLDNVQEHLGQLLERASVGDLTVAEDLVLFVGRGGTA